MRRRVVLRRAAMHLAAVQSIDLPLFPLHQGHARAREDARFLFEFTAGTAICGAVAGRGAGRARKVGGGSRQRAEARGLGGGAPRCRGAGRHASARVRLSERARPRGSSSSAVRTRGPAVVL